MKDNTNEALLKEINNKITSIQDTKPTEVGAAKSKKDSMINFGDSVVLVNTDENTKNYAMVTRGNDDPELMVRLIEPEDKENDNYFA